MNDSKLIYNLMIGVGGIGVGSFFLLNGDQTLGREESRSGHFLDKNDYCKLHIVSHYVKMLLGPEFKVIPVGKIGNDDNGRKLLSEMKEVGLELNYIETDSNRHTLFSFCILYPDQSGGNLTTDDSACSTVDDEYVSKTQAEFGNANGKGIALAVPEVPLSARLRLLEIASGYNFFRVASFTSAEMREIIKTRVLKMVDLLCINIDEAASSLNVNVNNLEDREIIDRASKLFNSINPNIKITITNGRRGSYVKEKAGTYYMPAMNVNVVSTAGAGDAFASGMIAGIAVGFNLFDAHQIAALAGSCSVMSPHTINKKLDRLALLRIAEDSNYEFSKNVLKFLEE